MPVADLMQRFTQFFAKTEPKTAAPPARLDEELARNALSIISRWTAPARSYNPDDDLVGIKGMEIYERMRRDDQVKAALRFKKSAALSTGWEIQPASDEKKDHDIADFVTWVLQNLDPLYGTLDDILYEVLSALDFGFSAGEMVITKLDKKPHAGKLGLRTIKVRKPHEFIFDVDEFDNLKPDGLRQSFAAKGYPIEKFLIFSYQREFGNFRGVSDLRSAYPAWWLKDNLWRWAGIYAERFSIPLRTASYPPGSYPEGHPMRALIAAIHDVLDKLQANTAITLPSDFAVQFHEASGQGVNVMRLLFDICNLAISRSILMPSQLGLGAESQTGSYAKARAQFDAFMLIVDDLRRDLSEDVMNGQLMPRLVGWNFGDVEILPKFAWLPFTEADEINLLTAWMAAVGQQLVKATPQDEVHIRATTGFPEREISDDEEEAATKKLEAEVKLALEQAKQSLIAKKKGQPIPGEPGFGGGQQDQWGAPSNQWGGGNGGNGGWDQGGGGGWGGSQYVHDPEFEKKHPRNRGKFAPKGGGEQAEAPEAALEAPEYPPIIPRRIPTSRDPREGFGFWLNEMPVKEGRIYLGRFKDEPIKVMLRRLLDNLKELNNIGPLSEEDEFIIKGVSYQLRQLVQTYETHAFGTVQIDLPENAANAVRALANQIPERDLAGDGRETEPHLTVHYGILPEADLASLRTILWAQNPFPVTLGPTIVFPPSQSSDWAAVLARLAEAPELQALHEQLAATGQFTDPTHPDYLPHVTLAYIQPGLSARYGDPGENVRLQSPISFTVSEVVLALADGTEEVVPLRGKVLVGPEQRVDFVATESLLDRLEAEVVVRLRKTLGKTLDALQGVVTKKKADGDLSLGFIKALDLKHRSEMTASVRDFLSQVYRAGLAEGTAAVQRQPVKRMQRRTHRTPQGLSPEKALAFFDEKSLFITGVIKQRLLDDTKAVLYNAIKGDTPIGTIMAQLREVFDPYFGDDTAIQPGKEEQVMPYRLETIIRTNASEAYNEGMKNSVEDLIVDGDVIAFYSSATLDARTTQVCRLLHGKYFRPSGPELEACTPPRHYNCRTLMIPVTRDEAPVEYITPEEFGEAMQYMPAEFGGQQRG